jgi:ribosomal protein S18 acetylase RimI-like enzyme
MINFTDKLDREIIIRPAKVNDAEKILRYNREIIAGEAFLLTIPDEFNITVEQERTWIESTQKQPNSLILIAEYQGEVVGFLDFHGGHKRRIAHTGSFSISVQGDYRGCGVGRSLIQTLVKWASDHTQIEKICLEVFASNYAAIELYRSMEFVQESLLKNHIKLESSEYVDIIGMARIVNQDTQ